MRRGRLLAWSIPIAIVGVMTTILFRVGHEAQSLELELTRLNDRIVAEQEALRVLRAEWAYLSHPGLLRDRAGELLALEPIRADAIIQEVDAIPRPLPPAAPPADAPEVTPEGAREPPALVAALPVVPLPSVKPAAPSDPGQAAAPPSRGPLIRPVAPPPPPAARPGTARPGPQAPLPLVPRTELASAPATDKDPLDELLNAFRSRQNAQFGPATDAPVGELEP